MKILWLSWKDRGHPAWGGAEVLTHELRKRFCAEGHAVTLLTSGYPGAPDHEAILLAAWRGIDAGTFSALHEYLQTAFPRVHAQLARETAQ